jgi:hypothetical protein
MRVGEWTCGLVAKQHTSDRALETLPFKIEQFVHFEAYDWIEILNFKIQN